MRIDQGLSKHSLLPLSNDESPALKTRVFTLLHEWTVTKATIMVKQIRRRWDVRSKSVKGTRISSWRQLDTSACKWVGCFTSLWNRSSLKTKTTFGSSGVCTPSQWGRCVFTLWPEYIGDESQANVPCSDVSVEPLCFSALVVWAWLSNEQTFYHSRQAWRIPFWPISVIERIILRLWMSQIYGPTLSYFIV